MVPRLFSFKRAVGTRALGTHIPIPNRDSDQGAGLVSATLSLALGAERGSLRNSLCGFGVRRLL